MSTTSPDPPSREGRFVVFEGGEGCGKSTQAAILAERIDALLTRQPGGTPLGSRLRAILLDPETGDIEPRAEALLMAADRAQHVADVIGPVLRAGRDVVCDRYVGSSVAYQGGGRGLDGEEVGRLSDWATGGRRADVVVLLRVPEEVAASRLQRDLDRFESAGADFHRRVAASFDAQAAADPTWVVVAGEGTVEEVAARVWASVRLRLSRSGSSDG